MFKKAISLVVSVSLLLTQPVFAQGVAELNIGKYLSQMPAWHTDSFRPPRLRYISYDIKSNDFKLLLDQGDLEKSPGHQDTKSPEKSENALKVETQNLFNYFLIGLTLPNDKFWVNLRPDAPEQIIDPELEKTDMGRIMLAADLQLKKDTAGLTSPQNSEGREYWDKLYKKAGELFGTENITIPTITRPWIVPGEVIIRESEDSSYIYKANLKVMLEEDYLTSRGGSRTAPTSDPRLKELNQYSTQLIRELILPKLTQEINTSKKYAQLRQVFFSLILSRWFKDRYSKVTTSQGHQSPDNSYTNRIDSGNLTNLTSKEAWSKDYYFNEYKKSFQQGEYNLKEQITTPTGQVIRSYVSGGADITGPLIEGGFKAGSPILTEMKKYTLAGLAILTFAGGVFMGGSVYTHLSEPTGIIESQERFNAIVLANYGFLIDLAKIAREGNGEGVGSAYIRWRSSTLAGLNRKQRENEIEALNNAIKSMMRIYSSDEKLIKVYKEAQELLRKEKKTGSSPLTQKDVREQIQGLFASLDRNYANHTEWKDIYRNYSFYAGFKIDEEKYLDTLNSGITRLVIDVNAIKDTALKNAARVLVDKFKNLSRVAYSELNTMKGGGVSSAITKDLSANADSPLLPGGIDFTRINYLTRPMGSFQGLDLRLPLLSKAELEGIDIGREMATMEQMINARIDVSTDRLKRLLAAMSQKDAFSAQRETQLLPLLLRLCWLKEDRGIETTPDFRAVLLIADTGLFVEQGNTKYSLN